MRTYEITNVIREGVLEETKNAILDLFAKHSLQVQSEEDWGSKRLWHPARREEQGHFLFFRCLGKPGEISKLEKDFKLNTNILKAMVIKANG